MTEYYTGFSEHNEDVLPNSEGYNIALLHFSAILVEMDESAVGRIVETDNVTRFEVINLQDNIYTQEDEQELTRISGQAARQIIAEFNMGMTNYSGFSIPNSELEGNWSDVASPYLNNLAELIVEAGEKYGNEDIVGHVVRGEHTTRFQIVDPLGPLDPYKQSSDKYITNLDHDMAKNTLSVANPDHELLQQGPEESSLYCKTTFDIAPGC